MELKAQDELIHFLRDKDISNLVPIAREIKARGLTSEQMETALRLSISVRGLEDKSRELSDSIERNKCAKLCEERSLMENQLENLMKQKGRLLEHDGNFGVKV